MMRWMITIEFNESGDLAFGAGLPRAAARGESELLDNARVFGITWISSRYEAGVGGRIIPVAPRVSGALWEANKRNFSEI